MIPQWNKEDDPSDTVNKAKCQHTIVDRSGNCKSSLIFCDVVNTRNDRKFTGTAQNQALDEFV